MSHRVSKWRAQWEWFRVPYVYWTDRVGRLSDRALVVDLGAWSIAWRDLTDGRLSERDVRELCRRAGCVRREQRERVVAELVAGGHWLEVDGGYELAGWTTWNPTRAELEARRESYRRRTATLRQKRAERAAAGESRGAYPRAMLEHVADRREP